MSSSLLYPPTIPGQNGPLSDGGGASGNNSPRNHPPTGDHVLLTNEEKEAREQDRLLPIANISRIMKKVLPDHAKMSKEAKAALQECVSEFIGFITSEASDRLMEEKRKTITGDDIIDSMRALGFDSYMEFLHAYLKKYRQSQKTAKGGAEKESKPLPPGAHKRGRKARGGDDDDEPDHSTSPMNVPSNDIYGNANMLTAQNILAAQMALSHQSDAAAGGGSSTSDNNNPKRRKQ